MRVLVISVHPDDETLGCGGTLLKHQDEGYGLDWVIVARAHEPQWSKELIVKKDFEIERVAEAYGMGSIHQLGFPATKLDALPLGEIIQAMGSVLSKILPTVVYLVHHGDAHTDHQTVFNATMTTLKSFNMKKFGVEEILSYETLSSTDASPPNPCIAFVPNVYNDITLYIERKIEIMNLYKTEMQSYPLPRENSAVKALARYRGAVVGVEYAEAFMLIRKVK